jgi:transglutaminase-like putative cysteine protease
LPGEWFVVRAALLAVLVVTPMLSGCAQLEEFFDNLTAPDARVQITRLETGRDADNEPIWGQENRFVARAIYKEPLDVEVIATASDGPIVQAASPAAQATATADGLWSNEAEIEMRDGIWDIEYRIDGRHWGDVAGVHIDTTRPTLPTCDVGGPPIGCLELIGDADSSGTYRIGASVAVPADATVVVRPQAASVVTANALPATVSGLQSGVHAYEIILTDRAGNEAAYTVQVRAGDAQALPPGEHTAGIVARFTTQLRLWDISDPGRYASPSQAAAQLGGAYLGRGFGIEFGEPDDLDDPVRAIVRDEVDPSMSTMDVALVLFRWMFDEVEYDRSRLDSHDLLTPAQTIANGGGVCRDLAALYVSLLRAAGVPARLVTGYLGGDNPLGFHAWVEFYAPGGPIGQDPWVPVDVSIVDGTWEQPADAGLTLGESVLLQSFGVKNPRYLQLRTVPADAESDPAWATAVSYSTSFVQSSGAPIVDFATTVVPSVAQTTRMCVDRETHERSIVDGCIGTHVFGTMPSLVEQVLDYGVKVERSTPGDTLDIDAAYPFQEGDPVQFIAYGPSSWRGLDGGSDVDGKIRTTVRL